ncbi:MAG: alpha-L-arabinofuranosidase C-terminal domain-containing protein [Phycisphaerae bacterium]
MRSSLLKRIGAMGMILSLVAMVLTVGRPLLAATTNMTINVDKPGIHVSPNLWGIFFEEVNYAGQGGLYAQLVKNGTFKWIDNQNHPAGWTLAMQGPRQASLWVDSNHALNKINPLAARVTVYYATPVGAVKLVNSGYWGMNFRKGRSYKLSFYARKSAGMGGRATAELLGTNGTVLARKVISGISGKWTNFHAILKSDGSDPQGKLAFVPTGHGSLYLNIVNLFPAKTWRGLPLRPQLARMLAALHPSFVRFPGGNYIEGNSLAEGFLWQKTIGPLADRPGHWNPWGYWVTDGLGYMEFLEMCQEMHAKPLFGFNCGISLGANDVVPMDQMEPWVKSAIDSVKFADAPADTKWGALRAKYGHPVPFHLNRIEIGNEDWWNLTNYYPPRYKVIYNGLLAKFPHLKTIYTGRAHLSKAPIYMVDDHYYNSPSWFWANRHLYDHRSRTGPKVFVGEYAVTHNCGTGNLRAALAEAAFMGGLERNSDIVRMASYAPLFVNVQGSQWHPDMIRFDSSRACGTVSYYVQQMYSDNRPTRMLPMQVTHRPTNAVKAAATGVGIGLGAWNTQSEFRNILVTAGGKTLYRSNFTNGSAGWKPQAGQWSVRNGVYQQTGSGINLMTVLRNHQFPTDYTLNVQARKLGGAEGFLIVFNVQGLHHYVWWNIGGWGDTATAFEHTNGTQRSGLGWHSGFKVQPGRWYKIRLVVRGDHFTGYINGQKIQSESLMHSGVRFSAIAGINVPQKMVIVKLINGTHSAVSAIINLHGAPALAARGTAITLTATNGSAVNSLSDPHHVVPHSVPVNITGTTLQYTFPARSFVILRIPEQ